MKNIISFDEKIKERLARRLLLVDYQLHAKMEHLGELLQSSSPAYLLEEAEEIEQVIADLLGIDMNDHLIYELHASYLVDECSLDDFIKFAKNRQIAINKERA